MITKSEVGQFRKFCLKYLAPTLKMDVPKVEISSEKAVVIVETRFFHHFLPSIRALLRNLGEGWSVYFFTGNKNYGPWGSALATISGNIHLINLGVNALTIDQYSMLMMDAEFWKSINAEKILIFQEDAISLRSGIEAFMSYDYIGAPWEEYMQDTPSNVGNGGVSLRSRSAMLEALEAFSYREMEPSRLVKLLMNYRIQYVLPEDVFFSNALYMLKKKIPSVATAKDFSMEMMYSESPMFCHKIWAHKIPETGKDLDWQSFLLERLPKDLTHCVPS